MYNGPPTSTFLSFLSDSVSGHFQYVVDFCLFVFFGFFFFFLSIIFDTQNKNPLLLCSFENGINLAQNQNFFW